MGEMGEGEWEIQTSRQGMSHKNTTHGIRDTVDDIVVVL